MIVLELLNQFPLFSSVLMGFVIMHASFPFIPFPLNSIGCIFLFYQSFNFILNYLYIISVYDFQVFTERVFDFEPNNTPTKKKRKPLPERGFCRFPRWNFDVDGLWWNSEDFDSDEDDISKLRFNNHSILFVRSSPLFPLVLWLFRLRT